LLFRARPAIGDAADAPDGARLKFMRTAVTHGACDVFDRAATKKSMNFNLPAAVK
jgi:hypothetical protein